jgi:cytochrome c oxidase subunit I+III
VVCCGLTAAALTLAAALAIELHGQQSAGVAPTQSAYAAAVFCFIALQAFYVAVLLLMAPYTALRALTGKLDRERRVTFDNTMLLWHYVTAQGAIALLVVHGFPRLVG